MHIRRTWDRVVVLRGGGLLNEDERKKKKLIETMEGTSEYEERENEQKLQKGIY